MLRVLLLNAFHAGSHRAWADAIVRHSRHQVVLITLPGRHWKWRMHGAAVQFAQRIPEASYDLMLVTDLLDLATLRGLRPDLATVPTIAYFHENQITYPWSPKDQDVSQGRDRRYGWVNYTTTMAADRVWFASRYHARVWQEALPGFLAAFPGGGKLPRPPAARFEVFPLPLNLKPFAEGIRVQTAGDEEVMREGSPVMLWNHRWEYDKNPEAFFSLLDVLVSEGVAFRLVVLGERYGRAPEVFAKAQQLHDDRILHWGYVDNRIDYQNWLLRSDVVLVTSRHDFFGISVVEALAAGAYPLVPTTFVGESQSTPYAEHLPTDAWAAARYVDRADCLAKLRVLLGKEGVSVSGDPGREARRRHILKYEAHAVVAAYDVAFERLVEHD